MSDFFSTGGAGVPRGEVEVVFGPDARVEEIRQARLTPPAASRGLWFVRAGGERAVLKLVAHDSGGNARWPSSLDPHDPWYWRREPLVYESGLAEPFGAPRLIAWFERGDGSVALWLEHADEPGGWTPGRLGEVAYRVGVAQARLAADLPAEDWLARGWLRSYLDLRRPLGADVDDAVLARLDALPQTLCHHDLHPANILGADASVVVDWAYCGIGAVGTDAGVLAADGLFDGAVPVAAAHETAARVWDGYANGLADGGLGAAIPGARWAFLAGTALRLSWIPGYLAATDLEPDVRTRFEALVPLLAAWADEARRLPSAP